MALQSLMVASEKAKTTSNTQNPITETATKAHSTQSPNKKSKAALKKEALSHAASSSTISKWRKKLMKYKSNNFENIRGNLIVVTTLIATMSFQVATDPPGGNWKTDTTNKKDQNCKKGAVKCFFGTLIDADTHDNLIFFRSLSFSASLSIILWLIIGVPLRNRVSVGILLIGMWATVLSVAATYYLYISLLVPHDQVFQFIRVLYSYLWRRLLE